MNGPNALTRQLEEQRFLHGVAYVEQEAGGLKKLSTSELLRINQFVTGETEDTWRFEKATVRIPSGRTHHFNVLNNPIIHARDVIGDAQRMAGNGDFIEAALFLYSQFVLSHLFRDGNRRTAVLATLWLLRSFDRQIDAQKLADYAIGDLRETADMAKLREFLKASLT